MMMKAPRETLMLMPILEEVLSLAGGGEGGSVGGREEDVEVDKSAEVEANECADVEVDEGDVVGSEMVV